jgi:bifunctional UDP-N-acetylglucosamine pyrophosphorylase/glucosamine-1-phosphate N-acetyltransferase
MDNLNIIVLAGGQSTRFAPLKNKLSYTFLGKSLLEIQFQFLKKLRSKKIYVVANELNFDDFSRFQRENPIISTVMQAGTGMAGAAMSALKEIDGLDSVLVLNMDDFFDDSLILGLSKRMEVAQKKKQGLLTGLWKEKYFPGGYLILDKKGKVTGVVEKPGEGNEPSKYVKMVCDFFYSAEIFRQALVEAKTEKDDQYEVAIANLIKKKVVFDLFEYRGRWETIKFPWHVLGVMDFFLSKIKGQQIAPDVVVAKSAVIKGEVVIESGSKIFEGAVINGPVYIGKNCIIANNALVRHSMVGDGCVVGFATEVARSYLMGNVWLHKNYVGDSVFENNVSLGSNVVTGNLRLDETNVLVKVKEQNVDTGLNKLGAMIGSDVRVGIGAMLMPGIKVGAGSFIGPGVVIGSEVEENSYVVVKQELKIGENRISVKEVSREKFKKQLK